MRDALRIPAFRHLATAYTVNELGNWIGDVALAILVFDRTGSPLATMALFLALRFAPAVLAPPLTTRVEVVPPRVILPILYAIEGAIFAVIAVGAHSFSLVGLLILAAADGAVAVAARALVRSVNASVLGSAQLLRQGNAIINLGETAGGAVGPALAGALVAIAGPGAALAVDAVTFGAVAIVLVTASGLTLDTNVDAGTVGRLRAGLSEVWTRRTVRRLMIVAGLGLMFGAAVVPIEVVFAKRTLHVGDTGYGLLMTSWGVGMLVGGAAFAGAARFRLSSLISAGMFLIGAAYAGLAASPDFAAAAVFSAIGGAGNGVWSVAVLTELQQAIPNHLQAAIMAVLESVNQVMPAVGFVLGGLVAAASSTRLAYATAAVGVAAVLLFQSLSPAPVARRESKDTPNPRDSPTGRPVN